MQRADEHRKHTAAHRYRGYIHCAVAVGAIGDMAGYGQIDQSQQRSGDVGDNRWNGQRDHLAEVGAGRTVESVA